MEKAIAITPQQAKQLLSKYTRVSSKHLCSQPIHAPLVLLKVEGIYYVLPKPVVERLLIQSENRGESFCKILSGALLQTDLQYHQMRRDFRNPDGEYGIYVDDAGRCAVYVNAQGKAPGKAPWYTGRRAQTLGAAAGVGALGVGAYLMGKRAMGNNMGEETTDISLDDDQNQNQNPTKVKPLVRRLRRAVRRQIQEGIQLKPSGKKENAAEKAEQLLNEFTLAWATDDSQPPPNPGDPYGNFGSFLAKQLYQSVRNSFKNNEN